MKATEELIAQGQALIEKEGKPRALCTLANAGDPGEAVLQTMSAKDYALAKALGKVYRLQQVLSKEGVNPAKQAERARELDKYVGEVVGGLGLREALKILSELGVEVN